MDLENNIEFKRLKRSIEQLIGFSCQYYRDTFLDRRIKVRMRANNIETYAKYNRLLTQSPEEQAALYSALTINVTQFFRNPEAWEAVKEKVFKPIIRDGAGRTRPLNIWSAGCSDGRETYTISMILARLLGHRYTSANIRILGTDIDRDRLETAASGVYTDMPMNKVKEQIPSDYFRRYVKGKNGVYTIRPDIKVKCSFRYHDLINGRKYKAQFDVIFCRNVFIYFYKDLQIGLFMDFIEAMKPGGYLILGRTETLFGPPRDRIEVIDRKERIYRLPG